MIVEGLLLALDVVDDEGSFARAAAALVGVVVSGVVFWDLSLSLSFRGARAVRKARRMEWGRSFMVGICLLAWLLALIFSFFPFFRRAANEGEMILGVRCNGV